MTATEPTTAVGNTRHEGTAAPGTAPHDADALANTAPLRSLDSGGTPPRIARRKLALAAAVVALGLPVSGASGLWSAVALSALGTVIAAAIVPGESRSAGRLALIHWWPIATLIGFLIVTALGVASSWTGLPIWGSREAATITWIFVVGAPLGLALKRSGRIVAAPSRSSYAVPAMLVIGLAAVLAQPTYIWARAVSAGTDFSRHALFVTEAIGAGSLDYSANAYPRSIHSALALVQSAAGDASYWGAWQAAGALMLVLLAVLAAASAVLASEVAAILGGPRWLTRLTVPGVVALLMLSGLWVTAMMPSGGLTSFEAGLIVVSAGMLLLDGLPWPSMAATAALVALNALMAHTWLLLLPLTAAPALWLVLVRVRDLTTALVVTAAGTMSVVVAAPVILSTLSILGLDAATTRGGIPLPIVGPSWLLLVGAAVLGIALVWRTAWRPFAAGSLLMFVGWMPVLAFLLAVSDGTLDGTYYLRKTAWTPLGVLLALGIPAAAWVIWRIAAGSPWVAGRSIGEAALRWVPAAVAVSALLLTQPGGIGKSVEHLRGEVWSTPFSIAVPVVEQFGVFDSADRERPPVVVWGLSPYMDADEFGVLVTGQLDHSVQSLFVYAGYPVEEADTLLAAVNARDPEAFCEYLVRHPDSVRVTGPYPEGPLAWLENSGCPDDVVRPQEWESIDIDKDWYRGTRFESVPFGTDYPTWPELQAVRDSRQSFSP